MANVLLFLAAAIVAGIASTSACNFSKVTECTKDLSDHIGDCRAIKNMMECLDTTGCSEEDIGNAKKHLAPLQASCEASNGGCMLQSCLDKDNSKCELYECVTMMKDKPSCRQQWNALYNRVFKQQYDKKTTECGNGNSNSGAAMTGCDFTTCVGEKNDCKIYACITGVRKTCKDNKVWEMTIGNKGFKDKYDSMSEKCSCGSLKPSLLVALTAAIFVFFRSSF